jgi:mono/diheme cytochrome c family protein
VPAGQRIYVQHCQVCHGPDGRGNGPAAPSLIPRPRDFTLGQFKYKSTSAGQPPNDADLIRVVSDGLAASAMSSWEGVLSEAEIREVVAYVKGFSAIFATTSPQPLTIPPRVTPDASSIARRRQLFVAQGCNGCHGDDGRGGLSFKDAKGYPVIARDLTAPWTFRGGSAPEQIWLRITTGLSPGPMPAFAEKLTPEQRWDVANYVLSLADGNWGDMHGGLPRDLPQRFLIGGQRLVLLVGIVALIFGPPRERRFPQRLSRWVLTILRVLGLGLLGGVGYVLYEVPQVGLIPPSVVARPKPALNLVGDVRLEQRAMAERGQYLYTIGSCALCHGNDGHGGAKVSWRPFGTLWVRNISSDTATGIGTWSDAEIARAIRSGVSRDGSALHWQGMTWDHFSNWDEEDIRALVVFLRTLPPISNKVLADRPPAPVDCEIYTFWTSPSSSYGCTS